MPRTDLHDSDPLTHRVRDLLRERYNTDSDSQNIALAAAEEANTDEHALDDFARAWHQAQIHRANTAAALSGAIAALADRLPDDELIRRTGVPASTLQALRSNQHATARTLRAL